MVKVEFKTNSCSQSMLYLNKFPFKKQGKRGEKVYWICARRKCKSRAHTIKDKLVFYSGKHCRKAHDFQKKKKQNNNNDDCTTSVEDDKDNVSTSGNNEPFDDEDDEPLIKLLPVGWCDKDVKLKLSEMSLSSANTCDNKHNNINKITSNVNPKSDNSSSTIDFPSYNKLGFRKLQKIKNIKNKSKLMTKESTSKCDRKLTVSHNNNNNINNNSSTCDSICDNNDRIDSNLHSMSEGQSQGDIFYPSPLLPLHQSVPLLCQVVHTLLTRPGPARAVNRGEDVGDYPGPSSSGGGSLGLEDSTSSPDHFLSEALADPKQASPLHQLPSSSSSSNAQRPESYKLCHNNHLSLVLEALAADESFMDVTLTAQGKSLKAHKSVLSAVSPYFRGVLKENPCQHPIIIMPRDVKYEELNNIISYIYRGEMTVATEDLSSLLKTAEILQVTGLSPSESMGGLDTIVNQNLADRINSPTRSSATPKSSNKKSTETPRNTTLSASSNLHSAESTPRSLFSDGIVPTDFMDVNLTCVKEELQSFDEDDDQDNLSRMKISNVTNQMSDTETEPPQKKRRTTTSKSQNAAPNDTTPEDPLPKQCPYCTEIPTDLETINEHLKDKHASEKVFVCSNCLRIYVNNDLYADHLKKCEDTSVL